MHSISKCPTRLAHRALLLLRDRAGERIECCEGTLWVTQERDPRDIVLEAGEAFTLDRRGTAIVHALADARLSIRPRDASSAATRRDALEGRAAA